MHKKILVTGASGFIGRHLCDLLDKRHRLIPTFFASKLSHYENAIYMDITSADSINKVVRLVRPEVIIHLAGNKNLNYCESHPDIAMVLNYNSTQYLVDAAIDVDAKFVFISSDYVFDGIRGNYKETDEPNPITVYGRTKSISEHYIMQTCSPFVILRTGAVYGKGGMFFSWIVESLSNNRSVEAFADAYFTPTYIDDVVWAFAHIVENEMAGIFHVAGKAVVSRYEMAQQVALHLNIDPNLVKPASVKGSGLLIAQNSSLNCEQTTKLLNKEFMGLSNGLKLLLRKLND